MQPRLLPILSVCLAVVAGCSSGSASRASAPATSSSPPAADSAGADVNGAGDIPDNQVYVPYAFPAGPFTVSVPEGWARTDMAGTTTFTDKFNSVHLAAVAAPTAPTVQSARDAEVPAIRAASTSFQLSDVASVHPRSGTAVLVTYTADSEPNPVTGAVRQLSYERYELWNSGREAIVVLAGPVGADNVDPWRTVIDSLTWQ